MTRRYLLVLFLFLLCTPRVSSAQATGSIIGRITDAASGAPVRGAAVQVLGARVQTVTGADGRYLLVAVPPGEQRVSVEVLGYRTRVLDRVVVRAGQPTPLNVELTSSPIALQGVKVEAERVPLVETNVSTTRDIVVARELKDLPIDRIDQAIELTPGVSGGHFRGGRVGQEVYVVDGLEVKNQFESSAQGLGLELSPTALEEVEVVTGGFGAQFGSALSGVVSYVTRRGAQDRWSGRAGVTTDQWAPSSMFYGFTGLSLSAGGPLRWLGQGTTLFTDVLAQGMLDSDPRARGLTCVQPADADAALQARIADVRAEAPDLYCPLTSAMLPHQRGDKLILFSRLDRPLAPGLALTVSMLRNRTQRELYTPEFRYANAQLGQRITGTLGTLALDWNQQGQERAFHATARAALMRIGRHLGVVDPWTFDGRANIAGFGPGAFRFLGEDFVHSPIEQQLASAGQVPGYAQPRTGATNPFGIAGDGLFYTEGTPHIANWSRTDMASFDVVGELLTPTGSSLRGGTTLKLYGAENYERTLSYLAGSSPTYARFYPRTLSAFTEGHIGVSEEINFDVGVRFDAFKSGINFLQDRRDYLSPVVDATWRMSLNPRFGVSMPLPGSDHTAALRFNYGYVSQPPDFRYFLDTTVGDSLRTDIRRQGNPDLSFERGKSYEIAVSKVFAGRVGVALTVFRKELSNVVTGSLRLGELGDQQYSTDDEGTVKGAEISARGRWHALGLRASYALQKATGISSGLDSDTLIHVPGYIVEYPLAFDRRHSMDFAAFYGRTAGDEASPWSLAVTGSLESGYPFSRAAARGDTIVPGSAYLPWSATVDLRLTRELGSMAWCGCTWRVTADGRNLLGRENVLAFRRETGTLAPSLAAVEALANARIAPNEPIPAESPSYAAAVDLDRNGVITREEFAEARFAAALARQDPTLFFGEARQLRLGVEVTFR